MSQCSHDKTVGILYCGDLGAAFARLMNKAGVRVVTTCENRSPRTQERAVAAEIEILPTLDAVVSMADVVVSLVLPDAAEHVARQYADRRHLCRSESLFVDTNSIDMQTLSAIETICAAADLRFVDATIHGGAKTLEHLGVMYVSGRDADDVSSLCGSAIRVHSLGERIGQATRLKLLMAGLSKGLNTLFLEIAIVSQLNGILDPFLDETKLFYPEIMTAIDRMLPTYPQHVARRVLELQSIEALARSVGAPHQLLHSAQELLNAVADPWHGEWQTTAALDIPRIIEIAAAATATTGADD